MLFLAESSDTDVESRNVLNQGPQPQSFSSTDEDPDLYPVEVRAHTIYARLLTKLVFGRAHSRDEARKVQDSHDGNQGIYNYLL